MIDPQIVQSFHDWISSAGWMSFTICCLTISAMAFKAGRKATQTADHIKQEWEAAIVILKQVAQSNRAIEAGQLLQSSNHLPHLQEAMERSGQGINEMKGVMEQILEVNQKNAVAMAELAGYIKAGAMYQHRDNSK